MNQIFNAETVSALSLQFTCLLEIGMKLAELWNFSFTAQLFKYAVYGIEVIMADSWLRFRSQMHVVILGSHTEQSTCSLCALFGLCLHCSALESVLSMNRQKITHVVQCEQYAVLQECQLYVETYLLSLDKMLQAWTVQGTLFCVILSMYIPGNPNADYSM